MTERLGFRPPATKRRADRLCGFLALVRIRRRRREDAGWSKLAEAELGAAAVVRLDAGAGCGSLPSKRSAQAVATGSRSLTGYSAATLAHRSDDGDKRGSRSSRALADGRYGAG